MDEREKIARKIRSMKKYVDFLRSYKSVTEVHMYEEVDIGELHSYLQTNLVDFDEFAKYLARYLKKGEQ
jgi:uncharacterized protein YutE (UPF0331/DUF86 family)